MDRRGLFFGAENAVAVSGFGLFGGGYAASRTNYTDKYTYSGDTVAAGTVL